MASSENEPPGVLRSDETQHRLSEWAYGQAKSERLSVQVLYADGFERIDPSHPLGGPDGQADALAQRDGTLWVMASYFPTGQRQWGEVKQKFADDLSGVAKNDAGGIAFVTNQRLTRGQRNQLNGMTADQVEIFHLERVASLLDMPGNHAVREQFLRIKCPGAGPNGPTIERPLVNLPPEFTNLVGRTGELAAIDRALVPGSERGGVRSVVVHGVSGSGKTRLALAAAYRRLPASAVAWFISAEGGVTAGLASLAEALGLSEAGEGDVARAADAARLWLGRSRDWVLVVDDATPRNLAELPTTGSGALLLTSQQRTGWGDVAALELGSLDRESSVVLLTASTQPPSTDAEILAAELGDLPLALAQAAGYVRASGIGLGEYLERFRAATALLLERAAPPDHERSVAVTWRLAFDALNHPLASRVLELSALCADAAIPRELFADLEIDGLRRGSAAATVAFDDAIARLAEFSLVGASPTTISRHTLVARFVREEAKERAQTQLVAVQRLLLNSAPDDVESSSSWPVLEGLLPHAEIVLQRLESLRAEDESTAEILFIFGRYLGVRYRFENAEKCLLRCVDLTEQLEGPGAPLSIALVALARVEGLAGNLQDAAQRLRLALTMQQEGAVPADTFAATQSNLGSILRQQGRLNEAIGVLEQSLRSIETVYPPDDPELIGALVNYGNALRDADRLGEAVVHLRRAAAIVREHPMHNDRPAILSNLGASIGGEEGATLCREALQLGEALYGDEHPGLAPLLYNAAVAVRREDSDEARLLFARALALEEQGLGSDHPRLAQSLVRLAELAGLETPAAREYFDRARRIVIDAAACEPMLRVEVLANVADFERTNGSASAAVAAAREVVTTAVEHFGAAHSQTASSLRTLGAALRRMAGERDSKEALEESLRVQERALAISRKIDGSSGEVADTLSNIGNLLGDLGRNEEALATHREAEELAGACYGDNPEALARILVNLAIACAEVGDQSACEYWVAKAWELDPNSVNLEG